MNTKLSDWTASERSKYKNLLRSKVLSRGLVSAFDIVNEQGRKPLIIAFEDETVESVLEQALNHGGSANLLVLFPDAGNITYMTLENKHGTVYSLVATQHLKIHRYSHIGLLAQYAAQQDDKSVSISFESKSSADFSHAETMRELLSA